MSRRTTTSNEEFHKVLSSSKHIFVISGAGLSAGSGIPTYRGKGGLWKQNDVMKLSTTAGWVDSPSRMWQFYESRRALALRAQPNEAHYALARFSIPKIRHEMAPESHFTLVTQNIDGLCQRALQKVSNETDNIDAATSLPIEMHGSIFEVACTNYSCKHREWNDDSPICPALAVDDGGVEDRAGDPVVASRSRFEILREELGRRLNATNNEEVNEQNAAVDERLATCEGSEHVVPTAELPKCTKCGSLVRPGVVWFGESPRHMDEIEKEVEKADICLVVGTSSTVHPAAGFVNTIRQRGGKVAVFNVEWTRDWTPDFLFLGPCKETLPAALGTSK
ncbi:hypothetical protein M408DRAFT_300425 [Serendipita vermifera MAFF 305830]|uniref:Deacetylase sirtuin-type domain-containing protein n=1 Tax=Serendipita vermifera MAFF 305830 TaxID=933852 RepID=A0A0C2WWP9_SERVB|nr:hypothetical protein M408DRAFT_300425 [Serendipita vermifera MAFF 305830]